MLVLSNEEIERLLTIEECMAALEPMYRDVAEERVLFSPRVDNIAPNAHPDGYYAFKHMGGTWPREKVQALRINSDVVTHPLVAGKPRRVKQPLANGRWVGLVLLFSTETGALLVEARHARELHQDPGSRRRSAAALRPRGAQQPPPGEALRQRDEGHAECQSGVSARLVERWQRARGPLPRSRRCPHRARAGTR